MTVDEMISKMTYLEMPSPAGRLYLASDGKRLTAVAFDGNWPRLKKKFGEVRKGTDPVLEKTKKQLAEYFAGRRRDFDLPLGAAGTEFQKKAWSALAKIPFGKTVSYRDQAIALKKPGASRAVGRANSLNPISIVVPCHRVISASGALTGYAGSLKTKEFLLNLESSREKPTRSRSGK